MVNNQLPFTLNICSAFGPFETDSSITVDKLTYDPISNLSTPQK
jgi:hypothetical protein